MLGNAPVRQRTAVVLIPFPAAKPQMVEEKPLYNHWECYTHRKAPCFPAPTCPARKKELTCRPCSDGTGEGTVSHPDGIATLAQTP